MTAGDSLECRYVGWGDFNKLRQMPLADNEALIYTPISGNVPVLIHGFLTCLRSEEVKKRFPEQFSENDLVEVIVPMLRNLPDSLLQEFNEWFDSAERYPSNGKIVVAAVISW